MRLDLSSESARWESWWQDLMSSSDSFNMIHYQSRLIGKPQLIIKIFVSLKLLAKFIKTPVTSLVRNHGSLSFTPPLLLSASVPFSSRASFPSRRVVFKVSLVVQETCVSRPLALHLMFHHFLMTTGASEKFEKKLLLYHFILPLKEHRVHKCKDCGRAFVGQVKTKEIRCWWGRWQHLTGYYRYRVKLYESSIQGMYTILKARTLHQERICYDRWANVGKAGEITYAASTQKNRIANIWVKLSAIAWTQKSYPRSSTTW